MTEEKRRRGYSGEGTELRSTSPRLGPGAEGRGEGSTDGRSRSRLGGEAGLKEGVRIGTCFRLLELIDMFDIFKEVVKD